MFLVLPCAGIEPTLARTIGTCGRRLRPLRHADSTIIVCGIALKLLGTAHMFPGLKYAVHTFPMRMVIIYCKQFVTKVTACIANIYKWLYFCSLHPITILINCGLRLQP